MKETSDVLDGLGNIHRSGFLGELSQQTRSHLCGFLCRFAEKGASQFFDGGIEGRSLLDKFFSLFSLFVTEELNLRIYADTLFIVGRFISHYGTWSLPLHESSALRGAGALFITGFIASETINFK